MTIVYQYQLQPTYCSDAKLMTNEMPSIDERLAQLVAISERQADTARSQEVNIRELTGSIGRQEVNIRELAVTAQLITLQNC